MSVRTHWSSRTAFILAAIGSAIGLGNLIRFPYICAQNGGGAFLVAYLVALVTAGIPIMILEFGLGHISEGSAPKAFRRLHPRLEWLGWIASFVGFFIVIYYCVIMAWGWQFFVDSFRIMDWAGSADAAAAHFANTLGLDKSDSPFDFAGMNWKLLVGLGVVWVAVVASVWKGATTVSKVVYATVLIPWAILLIFVVRAVTLPGAWEGLRIYLVPKWGMLAEPTLWLNAYTQVFFSLTIGFGVMIAYASFLPKKEGLVRNAVIICIADSVTAFVAGLAVYGCIGYLKAKEGIDLESVKGLGLTFRIYPRLIALLPGGQVIFGVLFYLMILTLGIDSAFSLLESFAASVRDKWSMGHGLSNIIIGVPGLLLGLPLITYAGLYWVDIADYFLQTFGLAVVALVQCVVVADLFGCRKLRAYINEISTPKLHYAWDIMITAVAPAGLLALLLTETVERIGAAYGGYPRRAEFLGGWLVIICVVILARIFQALPWREQAEEEHAPETFETT
jgi:NSS family neurotransmitter:Na+ symporter